MKCVALFLCTLSLCVTLYETKDLVVGTRVNNLLVSTEKVVYKGIPFIRRDKDYIYTDPKQRIIKVSEVDSEVADVIAIIARDLSRTEAEPQVTSGGVGSTHVTIHLRSERGQGLNYLVLIFSQNS